MPARVSGVGAAVGFEVVEGHLAFRPMRALDNEPVLVPSEGEGRVIEQGPLDSRARAVKQRAKKAPGVFVWRGDAIDGEIPTQAADCEGKQAVIIDKHRPHETALGTPAVAVEWKQPKTLLKKSRRDFFPQAKTLELGKWEGTLSKARVASIMTAPLSGSGNTLRGFGATLQLTKKLRPGERIEVGRRQQFR